MSYKHMHVAIGIGSTGLSRGEILRMVITRRAVLAGFGLIGLAGCSATSPSATKAKAASRAFTDASVTRGADDRLTIACTPATGTSPGPVQLRWGTAPDRFDHPLPTFVGATTIADPAPGMRPYFLLTQGDSSLHVAERRLPLSGSPNFRDLGGYQVADGRRVRWGRIYRSGDLSTLSPADSTLVAALDIHLVCDLRSASEVAAKPDSRIAAASVKLPVLDESFDVAGITKSVLSGDLESLPPDLLLKGTARIATKFPDLWSSMMHRLMDSQNLPTIVHCSGGKDRTGWASALVLRTLGVPMATVMQDYLLSNTCLAAQNAKTSATVRTIVAARKGIAPDQVDLTPLTNLLGVQAAYLQGAFDAVDKEYGSFEGYLTKALKLTRSQIRSFQSELLE